MRVWRDTAELWPGEDWRVKIRQAIQDGALVFIACFSQQSLARGKSYQNEELTLAIDQLRQRPPEASWLIPVRFDNCEIPDRDIGAGRTLASIQRADLFGVALDEGAGRLLTAILRILGPGAVPAPDRAPPGQPAAVMRRERWPDVDAIAALSPRVAASLVAGMTLDDAAVLLASAPVNVSAEVVQALLPRDEGLAISLLAHMSRRRAEGLVAAIASAPAWLAELPAAAEAIADRGDGVRAALGEDAGRLAHASPSMQETQGYYQSFKNGLIHWSARGGAQATTGEIAEYHNSRGGSGGRLGFPLTPEMPAQPSPFKTDGSYQRFESSSDYGQEICERLGLACGGTVYRSRHGAHATWGGIGEYYELNYGTSGDLGFPVTDEIEVGPSQREAGGGTTGWCQRFEGGAIYYNEKTKGAVAVPSHIADYHDSHGGVTSPRGFPVSPQLEAKESPYGTTGYLQRFEGTWDYPGDIVDHWLDGEGPGGATIYSSEAHGIYCVGWGNGLLYERLGGTGSWLGFPKSDETDARTSKDEPWCTAQEFEGGTIFFKAKCGSVTVSRAIMESLSQHDGLRQRLGFPVKEERPLASGDDERVQFFEHGVVTVRNGMIEAWLRAEDPS